MSALAPTSAQRPVAAPRGNGHRRPRVAYLCVDPGVPVFGTKGASVHIQEIIRGWRNRGAEVTIFCTRAGDHVPEDLTDIRVIERRLAKKPAAEREKAQADAAAYLAELVIAEGAEAVYERYSLFSDALARVTAALSIPGFLEVNAPLIDEQRTHRELHDEQAAEAFLRAQVDAAATVACVSRPVAQWVRARCATDHADKVIVTPNGVNTDRITPAAEAAGPPIVVFVGTLKPWHGVHTLIQARALAAVQWRLKIVGDGPQAPELRELAARLGVPVDFTGAIAPSDIPAALAGCALAAAPYPLALQETDQYFSPLKIYEYGAAGLPVVASRVGQIPDIVEHRVTGLLVEPSNPSALAAALDELAQAPQARALMAEQARRRAVERHGWDRVLGLITAGAGL